MICLSCEKEAKGYFCWNCGSYLYKERHCMNCDVEYNEAEIYCIYCGKKLKFKQNIGKNEEGTKEKEEEHIILKDTGMFEGTIDNSKRWNQSNLYDSHDNISFNKKWYQNKYFDSHDKNFINNSKEKINIGNVTINKQTEKETSKQDTSKDDGISNLLNGNHSIAHELLKKHLQYEPNDTFLNFALGVALTNGEKLKRLKYSVAKDIHQHFSIAYDNPDTRNVASIALIALKLDYFVKNNVKAFSPNISKLLSVYSINKLSSLEKDILLRLNMNSDVRMKVGL